MSQPTANIAGGWLDLGTRTGPDWRLYAPLPAEDDEQPVLDSVHYKELSPVSHYSRIPFPLKTSGPNKDVTAQFAKTADFAGNTWWSFTTPDIRVKAAQQALYRIAFTPNLGHHVAHQVQFIAQEVPLVKFDAVTMDLLSEANLGGGQYEGYMRDIGNVPGLLNFSSHLAPTEISVLLHPLFFVQKNKSSPQDNFPLCAAKHNTFSLNISFIESYEQVIRIQKNTATDINGDPDAANPVWVDWSPKAVNLSDVVDVVGSQGLAFQVPQVWCEYALVHGDERDSFKSESFDLAIKTLAPFTGPKVGTGSCRQALKFSGPTRYLAFAARNVTSLEKHNYANYSTAPEDEADAAAISPVQKVTLWYDSTPRIQNMPASHFSRMEFLLHAARSTFKKGVHLLPYCEDTTSSELDCTTNMSRLTTELELEISETNPDTDVAATTPSQYTMEVRAEGLAIIRFNNGVIEFPNFVKPAGVSD